MRPLEETITEVLELRKELDATMVTRNEERYTTREHVYEYGGKGVSGQDGGNSMLDWYEDGEVIVPEERGPDTQKREAARNRLQEIVDSSESHSAGYLAGLSLWGAYTFKDHSGAIEMLEHIHTRQAGAKNELANSRKARKLFEIYADNAEDERTYRLAGEALGYSPARMWLHELPSRLIKNIEKSIENYVTYPRKRLSKGIGNTVDTLRNYFFLNSCHMSEKTNNALSYTLITGSAVAACSSVGLMASIIHQGVNEVSDGYALCFLLAALGGGIHGIMFGYKKIKHANWSVGR